MSTDFKSSESGSRFPLKAYTVKQLADIYDVSTKTFRRWLSPFKAELGKKEGYFYNISQVQRIVDRLGVPGREIAE